MRCDDHRHVRRLLHEINDADDVRLPGTIRSDNDQGRTAEMKVERPESQKILDVQRINDQDRGIPSVLTRRRAG
jgi:hypothetical protein